MEKIQIGLNTYHIYFSNQESMQKWKEKNKSKYQIIEVYIDNGFGLEVKKLKKI